MAGEEEEDKENTPVQWGQKSGEGTMAGKGKIVRRSIIGGSNSSPQYLKKIAKRFQRKGGFGRGCITMHRPLQVDVSPYNFYSRAEDESRKRKSFVIFEDVGSVEPTRSKFSAPFDTLEKVPPDKRAKKATLEERIMLKRRATAQQNAEEASVQQLPKKHILEDFQTFRARNKVAAKQQLRFPSLLSEPSNHQDLASTNHFKRLAARWQRGGRGMLYTKPTPLDTSELEEKFRKMDQEDLHEMDIPVPVIREEQELVAAEETCDAGEGALEFVEEQAPLGTSSAAEPFDSRDWEMSSPAPDRLESGREIVVLDLTTPAPIDPKQNLRKDQEAPLAKEASPMGLELGDTPEASDAERALTASKQLTPLTSLPTEACDIQDLDTFHEIDPEKVEWALAQTVEAVQVWSVELDPSRRRRESLQYQSNRPSPWLKRLALSSLQSPHQLSGAAEESLLQPSFASVDHNDTAVQYYIGRPSPSLRQIPLSPNHLANGLPETSPELRLLQTVSLRLHGEQSPRTRDGTEIFESRPFSTPDGNSADGLATEDSQRSRSQEMVATQDSQKSRSQEMETWRDALEMLPSRRPSWPDQIPVSSHQPPEQMVGSSNEKAFENSPRSPPSESAEPLSPFCMAATPRLEHTTPITLATSPTPPTNPLSVYGYPYRRIDRVELMQRWLGFCSPPHAISSAVVETRKPWTVESALVQPPSLEPEESVRTQQGMPATTQEDALPVAGEEAASSKDNEGKPSLSPEELFGMPATTQEYALPVGREEAASSEDNEGCMDYGDDLDDISDDTTCIVQTGASSANNDQEGTSSLKGDRPEDALLGNDVLRVEATPVRDVNFVLSIDPVEYPSTHLDDEHIEQFVNSLQVTPGVNGPPVEDLSIKGEGAAKELAADSKDQCPAGEAEEDSQTKPQTTPTKDGDNQSAQGQGERTPTQQRTKLKRPRKTKTMKADSPLDAGSKWSNGQRKSTRIRSKPLEWWRGEKMLYGRVHSTLNTLIGIKHLSPDPVWPKPQGRKNKAPRNYRVDSFVPAKFNDLVRLAAQ